VLARIGEHEQRHSIKMMRLASEDHPIPASPPLEEKSLPGVDNIISRALALLER
jgi:pyruvate/2-oxoglutarate/acetoin dehydrogenase E1 component